jgi:predicted alpha/beta hydrolase family esterase
LKRAVLLHGTDGSPQGNWLPWLKQQLESRSYKVWVPELPNNHTPDRKVYNDFLISSGWDFTDNLVVGHSSGAVSVLNLLDDERFPKVKTAVIVSAWSDTHAAGLDSGDFDKNQFSKLFQPEGFNFEIVKRKAENFLFLHSDNDQYCPLDQAQWLAEQTAGDIIIIPGGGHLANKFPQFPQMIEALEGRSWL